MLITSSADPGERRAAFFIRFFAGTTWNPRCRASQAPSAAVIYPLTSVDWAWISAEMEGKEDGGGNEGLYKEEAALDANWLRLAP